MDNANRQGLRSLFEELKKLGKAHNQTHFATLIGEQSRGNLSNYLNGVKPLGDALAKQYVLHLHSKLPEVSHPWMDQLLLSGQTTPPPARQPKSAEAYLESLEAGSKADADTLPDVGRRTDVWVGKDDRIYWTEAVQVGDEEELRQAREAGVQLIPEYSEAFRGGSAGEAEELRTVETYWGIPQVSGNMIVPVRGDSMAPKYPAGCRVVLKPYPFNAESPLTLPFGEVYAVAVRQADGFPPLHFIKKLHRHPDKAKERLLYVAKSFNPDFEDFEVPVADICFLSAVVAKIAVEQTFDF